MIDIDSLAWDGDINNQWAVLSYAIQQLIVLAIHPFLHQEKLL